MLELYGFRKNIESDYKKLFESILTEVCRLLNISEKLHLTITNVSKRTIKKTNKDFRSINKVTDVLSFPTINLSPKDTDKLSEILTKENHPFDINQDDNSLNIGSVLICGKVVKKQAKEYENTIEREMGYMVVHSILHLLGFDHINDDDKAKMRKVEEDVLSALNLKK